MFSAQRFAILAMFTEDTMAKQNSLPGEAEVFQFQRHCKNNFYLSLSVSSPHLGMLQTSPGGLETDRLALFCMVLWHFLLAVVGLNKWEKCMSLLTVLLRSTWVPFMWAFNSQEWHIQQPNHVKSSYSRQDCLPFTRGLTEKTTQSGIISPIRCFKSPIGDILSNWVLVICSLTLRYQTHISPIPNWIHYPQLGIWDPQLGIIWPIGDIVC